jgi:type IV pilus assembly protein PilQ
MAIGTMVLQNRSYVNVSGPPVTLSLNNAPAKDALISLARLGGYGFVFIGDGNASSGGDGDQTVTMAFTDQSYSRALNSVLLASGLQAKLDGRTLMVGEAVSGKTFGSQMSKVYRMNQASAASAADYLASLGAQISKVVVVGPSTGDSDGEGGTTGGSTGGVAEGAATLTDVETYGASTGPLRGLTGTTDSRLETVTLVGDSQLILVAEGYLKQIDLRKRQVAVKVQILSVSLDNDKSMNSSFSSRIGDTFIVSENGNANLNFGESKPSSTDGSGVYSGNSGYLQPGVYETNTEVERMKRFVTELIPRQVRIESTDEDGNVTVTTEDFLNERGEKEYYRNPDTSNLTEKELIDENGERIYERTSNNERYRQPDDSFYAYLNSVIVSSSAKTLAQPTLLVQEGEEAKVETGESVITGRTSTETSTGSVEFTNTRENAGLELTLKVSKIDDNGFVTMNVDPEISVPVGAGTQGGVPIFNISGRKLSSGSIRLRDRQTLILTGVIQESDRQQVEKWPILGDMPIIGQLFRGSASSRQKNELVIIVTPNVLDDNYGGMYGYGYSPSIPEARQLMGRN